MLRDLQRVAERDTDHGAEPFKAAAARLLRDQFLLRERVGDREALRLVSNHYDYFESLFDALGWSLRRDDDFGVIGILPDEGQTRARLRLIDTLIVLCLRLLYEEGFDRFEVRDGCVFTESQTLIERYESLFTGRRLRRRPIFAICSPGCDATDWSTSAKATSRGCRACVSCRRSAGSPARACRIASRHSPDSRTMTRAPTRPETNHPVMR
jgi:hypothetical protein